MNALTRWWRIYQLRRKIADREWRADNLENLHIPDGLRMARWEWESVRKYSQYSFMQDLVDRCKAAGQRHDEYIQKMRNDLKQHREEIASYQQQISELKNTK